MPAGEVSFRVFLDKPLFLTASDQHSVESIEEALKRHEDSYYRTLEPDFRNFHHFIVPGDCLASTLSGENMPKYCQERFLAEGQIAGTNFQNACFIPVNFFILKLGDLANI